ncbi:MAG TPA: pilus assembly protein PilM [Vicinamibacterales bacterium]|jgi:Tfp pilus assembly PilM family ATPase|nr:pilus assembly protein PilM [Vicinamibacterales bacterium]
MSLLRQFSIAGAPPPDAAVEIAAHRVSAIALSSRSGKLVVSAHASEPLPDGALVPSLTAQNARDAGTVASVVKRVLEQVGRPRRVGLVVPDGIAKVSLVRFAQVPPRAQDLDQLIRWQVRKAAPFPIEEAQVSYAPGLRADDGQDFLVSLARRDVIGEYEGWCTAAGAQPGLVDISTFNVINAVVASEMTPGATPADWLLVNVASDSASTAILRGPHLILFRNRTADADATLADLVHQTAMYYEDRLGGAGFSRVLLSGASSVGAQQAADVEQIRRGLEERLGKPVETVDPRGAVTLTDRITASPAFLDALAPLVGMLARDSGRAA